MSLHSLLSVTIGVPNVAETAAYYAEFGLTPGADGWFSTVDAGRQLRILPAPTRRLLALRVGADDADDLARAAANLTRLGVPRDLLPASRGPRRHDDRGAFALTGLRFLPSRRSSGLARDLGP